MKIKLTIEFNYDLKDIVDFISKDKPITARKFKIELIKSIKKDLLLPFHFKKSKYFEDENIRDYVFKGYTSGYEINTKQNYIVIFAFIKHKKSL